MTPQSFIQTHGKIEWLDRPQRLWVHIADRLEDAVYNPNNLYTKSLDWRTNEESDSLSIFEEYRERYLARMDNNRDESRSYGYGYWR